MLTTSREKIAAATGVPKKSGEYCAHAAHDRNLFIPLIQFKPLPKGISDAASQLKSRPLTTRRATPR